MADFREKLNRSFDSHKRNQGDTGDAYSYHTLMTWSAPRPEHGDNWGNWIYDAETLVLRHKTRHYEMDLEQCATSGQTLDRIFQICGKSWATAEDLGHLIQALDDLLKPQANLCSF